MKFSNLIFSLPIIILIVAVSPAQSATIRVPADQPTIQAGIDAASIALDTVLVADGIYTGEGNRDINFKGKNIVVKSENGPEYTIIDCEGTVTDRHIGFYLYNSESTLTEIDGFTIRNGYGPTDIFLPFGAGAIYLYSAHPRICNNIIENNVVDSGGSHVWGGAILAINSQSTFEKNIIRGNTAKTLSGRGGAVFVYGRKPKFIRNEIIGNSAQSGGGLYFIESDPTIIENSIIRNISSRGGGLFAANGAPQLFNNLFTKNEATGNGGGVFLWGTGPIAFENNTLTGNSADSGAGLFCVMDSQPILKYCIFAYNQGSEAVYADESSVLPPPISSNVYNNMGGDWVGPLQGFGETNGNLSEDALFCDTSNGDYHLSSSSSCVPAFSPWGKQIGALGIGCTTNSLLFSEFDTLFAAWSKSIEPQDAIFLIGDFNDGNSAADIVPSSIMINNTLMLTSVAILESHIDFFEAPVEVSVSLANLVKSYSPLYNTTVQELSISGRFINDEVFELVRELVYVGHSSRDFNRDKIVDIRDLLYLSNQAYRAAIKSSTGLEELEEFKSYLFPRSNEGATGTSMAESSPR